MRIESHDLIHITQPSPESQSSAMMQDQPPSPKSDPVAYPILSSSIPIPGSSMSSKPNAIAGPSSEGARQRKDSETHDVS